MKKILIFLLVTLALISLFCLPTFAAQYTGPQDTFGLTACSIYYILGSTSSLVSPTLSSSNMVPASAYSSGLDLADLIVHQSIGSNTKITFYFYWNGLSGFKLNEVCIKGIPADFHITVSLSGTSSMTGSSISTSLSYVDSINGWSLFDNYSTSATMTPLLSSTTGMTITIDGGSAQLKTLQDDDIILSLSKLPYNLSSPVNDQYQVGYNDAKIHYSAILQREKDLAYEAGKVDGYSKASDAAYNYWIPEAEDAAREEGRIIGKAEGLELSENADLRKLIFTIPEAFLTAFSGFTNWELLGYNLYDLLGGVVTLVCVAFAIRFCIKLIV